MNKGGNMNKSGLIEALSKDTGLPSGKAEEVVKVFFDEMANALVSGDRVEVRGLCSMFVKQYDGYTGRNPKTGKLTEVKSKKLPFFKCGKELKERVDIQ
jgi:integration host factor subunit beta